MKPVVKPTVKDTALKTDIGALLTRSNQARDSAATNRRNSKDETTLRGGYSSPTYGRSFERDSSPKYTSSVRTRANRDQPEESKYGSTSSATSG